MDELDAGYAVGGGLTSKTIAEMMPDAWRLFFRARHPWNAQVAVMPHVLRGESLLFCAPTASGKTEAIFAPLYQRHVSFRREATSIVAIAPTKALVNDLYERISIHLHERAPLAVARYTGDHHQFDHPERSHVLISTPEALDSLQLMRPDSLRGIRAVVIDEVHLLQGTARGQQLRRVMDRIELQSAPPSDSRDIFQRVAMSATLDDAEGVARLWLGETAKVIASGAAREIQLSLLQVSVSTGDDRLDHAQKVASLVRDAAARKILAFTNSRNSAQSLAAALATCLRGTGWPVHLHHGLLGGPERDRVESSMRTDKNGICVATATLEIGIDIGDVDLIVLADVPSSVSGFLQRIGRGNRRSKVCKVIGLWETDLERDTFEALLQCARQGLLDDVHEYPRASVDFQQVLSFAWRGVRQAPPVNFRTLAAKCGTAHEAVVADMLSSGALKALGNALVPCDRLMDMGDKREIHTVISGSRTTGVIDAKTGDILMTSKLDDITNQAVYVGGQLRKLVPGGTSNSAVGSRAPDGTPLAHIPTTFGNASMSRAIAWQIARGKGLEPNIWLAQGTRVLTWGGDIYNLLLQMLLSIHNPTWRTRIDAFSISGLPDTDAITPTVVLGLAESAEARSLISDHGAKRFVRPSRFFGELTNEMQAKEARAAIPFAGFRKWLGMCRTQTQPARGETLQALEIGVSTLDDTEE